MKLLVGVVLHKINLSKRAQEVGERLVQLERLADCLLIIDNGVPNFEEVQKMLPPTAVVIQKDENIELDGRDECWRRHYVNGRCVVIRSKEIHILSYCFNFILEYSRTYRYGWALILGNVPPSPDIVSTSKEVAAANERLGVVCSRILYDNYLVLTDVLLRATTKEEESEMYKDEKSPWRIYSDYNIECWCFINPFNDEDEATFYHNEGKEIDILMEQEDMKERALYEQDLRDSDRLDDPSDAFDSEADYWEWKLMQ